VSVARNKPSKSSASRTGSKNQPSAEEPPRNPLPERRRPILLIVSSVLLAAWLFFLAAMAYISMQGDSIP
jgi:hypothetical protein